MARSVRKQVNLHAAKTSLSRLVDEAMAGQEIVIAKAGKPMVRLVPVVRETRRTGFGADKGKIWISDDFDAPLPPDVLRSFGIDP
ncbi:MAG TPA: type II toxin-antitoxin system prevent-host-death family antitoxin [Vicinamibacterales bacterium]|nr:type II toxin-antitoxin system prevent-host-death family antitoxin [Vicinamibacterales bacterium]